MAQSLKRPGGMFTGENGTAATPLSEKSEEYRRVLYLLQMSTRNYALSDVCIWHFGNGHQAVKFERRTRGMLTVPAWHSTRRLSEANSLENLHSKGFTFPTNGEGLSFSTGDLDFDISEGSAHRFLLCQVGVGKAFVVDDPSEQTSVPEGYDSLYLALSTSLEDESSSSPGYRHEYTVGDPNQVLPMYLVQFFIDSDVRNSEIDFGAANRNDDYAPASLDKLYDRYDFFDPILYCPVSVRDKMIGSHSSGELAQHKLIGIGDAYESAVSESMKVDPIIASRREEIKSQLRAVDGKLRDVNKNSAAVEEKIYKTLQEALFHLQDITQGKMSALLAEEVELRRQLQQIDWMESFLDIRRDHAAQVEFLNSWKCHVQLRADAVRTPIRTPSVLSTITADLDLVGAIQLQSRSAASKSRAAIPPPPPSQTNNVSPQAETSQREQIPFQQEPSRQFFTAVPPQQNGQPDQQQQQVPVDNALLLRKMFSQHSMGSSVSSYGGETPSAMETKDTSSQNDDSSLSAARKLSIGKPSPPESLTFTFMSSATPARFAPFSLRAEAVRRLRQLQITPEESLTIADEAFQESKIFQHPDTTKEMELIRQEQNKEEEERSEEEEEDTRIGGSLRRRSFRSSKKRKSKSPVTRVPKVYCDAQSVLLAIPFRRSEQPPVTKLLYATWKPGTRRHVKDILATLPKQYIEEDSEEEEDDERKHSEPKYQLEDTPTVLIIKSNDRVFGGYADEPWSGDGTTCGTAKCFLFSSTLDIKIPFTGRKTLEPPPRPSDEEEEDHGYGSDEDMETGHPSFGVLKSDSNMMQFGVRDLVLRDNLVANSSELEFSFGVGLTPGGDDALTLLAGSTVFKVDELELWAIEYE